jgi:hypothetical protein
MKIPKDFSLSKPYKAGPYYRVDIRAGNTGIGHISYKVKGKTLVMDMVRINVISLRNKGYAGTALAKIMKRTDTIKIVPTEDGFSTQGKNFVADFMLRRK